MGSSTTQEGEVGWQAPVGSRKHRGGSEHSIQRHAHGWAGKGTLPPNSWQTRVLEGVYVLHTTAHHNQGAHQSTGSMTSSESSLSPFWLPHVSLPLVALQGNARPGFQHLAGRWYTRCRGYGLTYGALNHRVAVPCFSEHLHTKSEDIFVGGRHSMSVQVASAITKSSECGHGPPCGQLHTPCPPGFPAASGLAPTAPGLQATSASASTSSIMINTLHCN